MCGFTATIEIGYNAPANESFVCPASVAPSVAAALALLGLSACGISQDLRNGSGDRIATVLRLGVRLGRQPRLGRTAGLNDAAGPGPIWSHPSVAHPGEAIDCNEHRKT